MNNINEPHRLTITGEDIERLALEDQAEQRLDESGVRLSWELLALLEPELESLLEDAQTIHDDGESISFCANRHWYLELKPRLVNLVGWSRESFNPILSTRQAYDLAYDKLYAFLPPCRHDGPLCL